MAPRGQYTNLTRVAILSFLALAAIYVLTMPFRQQLQGLLNKAEQAVNEHSRPHNSQPPPIPTASKPRPSHPPTDSAAPQLYWQPDLSPSTPVTTNFYHETGQHGWGNNEAQNYISSQANSFHNSQNTSLILRAIINSHLPSREQQYTSARLSSHQTLSRPRGRLSAHITAPVASGIWPAFWLLPADPFTWPTDGEVDIFEAWDGERINHSCLHWGFFDGNDWDKHRVLETELTRLQGAGHTFDFVWDEDERTGQGRLIWYIDSRPVMRATKPAGTRKMRDFRILINIAVGGNVCKGHMPRDGTYEMQVSQLGMWDAPERGWANFQRDWDEAREGHPS